MTHDLRDMVSCFALPGDFMAAVPYGSGHINDTYAVTVDQGGTPVRYILQRINHQVFKQPGLVMTNIERVVAHLRHTLEAAGVEDVTRRTLTLIPTTGGDSFHVDAGGNHWRIYVFIEKAQTYDEITSTDQAFQAARAFGRFQEQLRDLPGPRLQETIPGFHDTRARFAALQRAIEADACNRAAEVAADIAFALDREPMVDVLLDLHRKGDIPEIITHSDTKLNNVMLDNVTGEGICVIDLDTVMPGLFLYDFGDMVRTAARPTPEDEPDLSKVEARLEMFEAVTRGYLDAVGPALTCAEREHLVFSARLITFEIGIRFLTDYLEGDVYFKTHRDGHNRDRCRVQFAMVSSFESRAAEMDRIAKAC